MSFAPKKTLYTDETADQTKKEKSIKIKVKIYIITQNSIKSFLLIWANTNF